MAECTESERKFLDELWKGWRSIGFYRCPFCSYDGLGAYSRELEDATKAVVLETDIFSDEEKQEIIRIGV